MYKKIEFLKKHKKLNEIFNIDDRIIGIFGSYSKGTQTNNSDIDLFIIGNKKENDYDLLGKKFDLDISIKYFSIHEFKKLLNKKNPLISEIVKNKVLSRKS
jgi:uncharacterized protein